MLTTFFSEPTTQSNTAFSFGIRLIVFNGRKTRKTRKIFIVALQKKAMSTDRIQCMKIGGGKLNLQKFKSKTE